MSNFSDNLVEIIFRSSLTKIALPYLPWGLLITGYTFKIFVLLLCVFAEYSECIVHHKPYPYTVLLIEKFFRSPFLLSDSLSILIEIVLKNWESNPKNGLFESRICFDIVVVWMRRYLIGHQYSSLIAQWLVFNC